MRSALPLRPLVRKLNVLLSYSRDCWKLSIPACLYVIQNNVRLLNAERSDQALNLCGRAAAIRRCVQSRRSDFPGHLQSQDSHHRSLLRLPPRPPPFRPEVGRTSLSRRGSRRRPASVDDLEFVARFARHGQGQGSLCRILRLHDLGSRRRLLRDGAQGEQGRPLDSQRPALVLLAPPGPHGCLCARRLPRRWARQAEPDGGTAHLCQLRRLGLGCRVDPGASRASSRIASCLSNRSACRSLVVS